MSSWWSAAVVIAIGTILALLFTGHIRIRLGLGQGQEELGQAKGIPAKAKRLTRPPPVKGAKTTMTAQPKTGRSAAPRMTTGLFRQPRNPFRRPAEGAKMVKSNNSLPEPFVVPEPLSRVIQPGVRGVR